MFPSVTVSQIPQPLLSPLLKNTSLWGCRSPVQIFSVYMFLWMHKNEFVNLLYKKIKAKQKTSVNGSTNHRSIICDADDSCNRRYCGADAKRWNHVTALHIPTRCYWKVFQYFILNFLTGAHFTNKNRSLARLQLVPSYKNCLRSKLKVIWIAIMLLQFVTAMNYKENSFPPTTGFALRAFSFE